MKTEHQNKSSFWKKVLFVLLAVVLTGGVAFGIYVQMDYQAVDVTYAKENKIPKIENQTYIVYGDTTQGTGLIFYQGGKVEEEAYEPILCEIVKEGGCAILAKMPMNLAVFKMDAAEEIIEDFPEITNWYIGGHSLGGAMAANYAADHAEKLKGLILLAAYPTKEIPQSLPVLSVYGSEDGVLNLEKYEEAKKLMPQRNEVLISGGNHAQFGNYGEQKGDGTASISPYEQWQIVAEQVKLFLR